ncbi:MAG: hypothetical protein ACXVRH_01025 [Thermoleophilaceae bacterium]
MADVAVGFALLCAALNVLAGGVGAWLWWRVLPATAFWPLARAGQVAAIALAVVAGVAAAAGGSPSSDLFWLYAVLPVAVSFVAEQLRIASAQTVLDARGLEDARAMGALPAGEQHSVVLAIVRRELGVMTAAAIVMAFLALRAAATTSGL